MWGSGCCSNSWRVVDVCELRRFVVLSVLVFFVELADFGNGSRCCLILALGSICACGTTSTHTEQGHVVKANGN